MRTRLVVARTAALALPLPAHAAPWPGNGLSRGLLDAATAPGAQAGAP